MSATAKSRLTSLEQIRPQPHSKPPDLVGAIQQSVLQTHARLGLPPPPALPGAERPWVVAAEQLGVELRPATVYKVVILSLLAEQGYAPIFMFEERDVASKATRLKSWALPRTEPHPDTGFVQHLSPLGRMAKKAVEDVPLLHVPVSAELPRTRQLLVQHYAGTVERAHLWRLERLVEALLDSIACFAQGASLADYGQRQLVEVSRRMGLGSVLFCNLGALEDRLLASDFDGFLREYPLAELTARGLVPPDCAPFWGEHRGDCHGRVRVRRDGTAGCLRCKAELTARDWAPFSLRAAPRMLALDHLGVDLFITGGTSGYNAEVRSFQHARGRRYPPLLWRCDVPYAGPYQRASAEVAALTSEGEYSFLDALIGTAFDDPEGAFHVVKRGDPVERTLQRLAERMTAAVRSDGVHHDAQDPDAADSDPGAALPRAV